MTLSTETLTGNTILLRDYLRFSGIDYDYYLRSPECSCAFRDSALGPGLTNCLPAGRRRLRILAEVVQTYEISFSIRKRVRPYSFSNLSKKER